MMQIARRPAARSRRGDELLQSQDVFKAAPGMEGAAAFERASHPTRKVVLKEYKATWKFAFMTLP